MNLFTSRELSLLCEWLLVPRLSVSSDVIAIRLTRLILSFWVFNVTDFIMVGYSADEKLRVDQITTLRRKWLKDQELSPREPVVEPKPPGRIQKFWTGFLEPKSLWRLYVSLT